VAGFPFLSIIPTDSPDFSGCITPVKVSTFSLCSYVNVKLQPGRRNSGESEPQMHISKEGDPYLRTLLVQGAHHILGPLGADSDLRRWGLKLAERGGKNGKKRAVITTARKLAVLLHRLWMSGEVYEPLRNSRQGNHAGGSIKSKSS
jgi:hypothetical protein